MRLCRIGSFATLALTSIASCQTTTQAPIAKVAQGLWTCTYSTTSKSAIRKVSDFLPNGITDHSQNLGQAITCAQQDLINNGIVAGILDATDLTGTWSIVTPVQLGLEYQNSFTLRLGRSTITTRATITLGRTSAIKGEPTGSWAWISDATAAKPRATVISAPDGASFSGPIIRIGGGSSDPADPTYQDGTSSVIQDLVLDGNFRNGGSAVWANCISVDQAPSVEITRTSLYNCGGHGISITSSSSSASESGNAVLTKVFAKQNYAAGLAITNTADVMVANSQFEENNYGVYLNNSGGIRINHCDFGGNTTAGLHVDQGDNQPLPTAGSSEIITGNQFGKNWKNDIEITGGWGAHVISANHFIGSPNRTDNQSFAIYINGALNNTVTGNFFNSSAYPNRLQGVVYLQSASAAITGNVFTGSAGSCGSICVATGGSYVGSGTNLNSLQ